MPHTQQPFFEKEVLVPSITDLHCFPFVTVWKSLHTAFSVGELGNKSITAWRLLRIALDWDPVE